MDEFKPEDELKPDTSDRRPTRPRKTSSAPKVPVSRQHMMMGIGILVLLLLVLGIGSALKSPDSGSSTQQSQTPAGNANTTNSGSGEKNIDLSGSSSMSGQSGQPATQEGTAPSANEPAAPSQNVGVPPISPTPTEAQPVQTPANQQRVELPGDLNNALSNQQGQVDAAAQAGQGESSLPTGAATVAPGAAETPRPVASKPATTTRPAATHQNKPAAHSSSASKPAVKESKPAAPASRSSSTPGGNFTLQLSSASRSDTLNAWAKKQNLSGYHVYQTTRNGQPWYVLVSGSYATSSEAKRAVASLPAEVRAQNPWVKPVSQVKKEAGK
ncbi:SPOR domain-containing protein [Erwinia persicina]|uniref:SPOR domain-containing protein n=1 Tax=Erwinia persicina TaxID=55211 RepID=UPI00177F639B|nr:SPOR domain-containing protein [Erwinia persicina]MBD8163760.1 SPOR domain-containing protein [Erwinia persicina]